MNDYVRRIILLIRLFLVGIAGLLLAACSSTWLVHPPKDAESGVTTSRQMAIVEKLRGRNSPKIKTFRHIDLGVYKESAGSRHNNAYAVKQVVTYPGLIEVGVILPGVHRVYYPEVRFNAEAGHKYGVTWLCLPYPFVAVVDEASSKIVAVDAYCPNCEEIIGTNISQSSACLNHMQPAWMKPDVKAKWWPWYIETRTQLYRNLCTAAEHNITSAQKRLAVLYKLGIYRVRQNTILAYVWYLKAAASGDKQATKEVQVWSKRLSLSQREQARGLVKAWRPGKCEAIILGKSKSKYKIRFKN